MKQISDAHYRMAVEIITDFVAANKTSANLLTFNKARRAGQMIKAWKRKEATDGKKER
jgi:hypothetical protein